MANYSNVPCVVTITNIAEPVKAYDAGALQRAKEVLVDENGQKYALVNAARKVQFYKTNKVVELAQGESIEVMAETSAELAYFASLEVAGELTVDYEGKEVVEETVEEEDVDNTTPTDETVTPDENTADAGEDEGTADDTADAE